MRSEVYLIVIADAVKTGGMDRANFALIEVLARSGREVHVVAHSVAERLREYPNLIWHAVPRPLGHDALGWSLLAARGQQWARQLTPRQARVLVNGGNCPWPGSNWVHYVHAAHEPRWGHETGWSAPARRGWNRWKRARALRDEARALARARLVFANSERTRADLLRLPSLAEKRIVTVYYGCDGEIFRPATPEQRLDARQCLGWAPERDVALFVGALGDRRKGFDTLFAAWRELCQSRDWTMDLAIVGSGREASVWRQRAAAAGLNQRCHFLGFRDDVPEIMRACDLLLAPTRYEAFGLGVQEALACGLPALVSAAAGVTERMPAALAPLLLTDPESPPELIQRLQWWRGHRQSLAPALRQLSQSLRAWTWDDMAQAMIAEMERGPDG